MISFTRNQNPKKILKIGQNYLLDSVNYMTIHIQGKEEVGWYGHALESIHENLSELKKLKDPFTEISKVIIFHFNLNLKKYRAKNIKIKLKLSFFDVDYYKIDHDSEKKIMAILNKLRAEHVQNVIDP